LIAGIARKEGFSELVLQQAIASETPEAKGDRIFTKSAMEA